MLDRKRWAAGAAGVTSEKKIIHIRRKCIIFSSRAREATPSSREGVSVSAISERSNWSQKMSKVEVTLKLRSGFNYFFKVFRV